MGGQLVHLVLQSLLLSRAPPIQPSRLFRLSVSNLNSSGAKDVMLSKVLLKYARVAHCSNRSVAKQMAWKALAVQTLLDTKFLSINADIFSNMLRALLEKLVVLWGKGDSSRSPSPPPSPYRESLANMKI